MGPKRKGRVGPVTEPWLLEQAEQDREEQRRRRLPRCTDCGEPILEEKALLLGEHLLCRTCRQYRMVEVEPE